MNSTSQPILKVTDVSKSFGSVQALKQVSFEIFPGEILAILGENGAGKSTLMKILNGLYRLDSGKIEVDRGWFSDGTPQGLDPVFLESPKQTLDIGIGMVFQHFQLVESFTVGENITLGYEFVRDKSSSGYQRILMDYEKTNEEIMRLSNEFKLPVDPSKKVEDLPVGIKQRVEILKQLYRQANLLILDEPTAVLTPLEVDQLFNTMASLRKSGKSIVFISHKLKEPLHIADRIIVIRKGEIVSEVFPQNVDESILANLVVGRKLLSRIHRELIKSKKLLLAVQSLNYEMNDVPIIKNLEFELRTGEILGVAGVEGNGQTELSMILIGLLKETAGNIFYYSKNNEVPISLNSLSTLNRLNSGIGFIPEDRNLHGLIDNFSIAENVWLAYHSNVEQAHQFIKDNENRESLNKGYILPKKLMEDISKKIIKAYDIKAPNSKILTKNLSGGNQQKVIIGRELSKTPNLVIASQPTRGVDIGVMEQVHEELINLRNNGSGVLLISADLDEVLKLSDRLIVMFEGEIVAELSREEVELQKLSLLMTTGKGGK